MTRKANISPPTSALVLTMALTTGPALGNSGPIAEVICAPTAQMRTRLQSNFGAERVWQGIRSPDEIMELWEDSRGYWTLAIEYAAGNLCIVAMGEALTGFPDMY